MACKHPLKRFILPDGSGKVTSYDTQYLIRRNNNYIPCNVSLPGDIFYDKVTEFQEIPCGHCISCRLEYSRQWANRMLMELEYHDKACFITLTYDDDHLPDRGRDFLLDEYTGEVYRSSSLVKSDLQGFIKKLRNKHRFEDDFYCRYYGVGEYGSKSFRPHYHMILYGYDFPDKFFFKQSPLGNKYFISDELSFLWPYGLHIVTEVSWETMAYCARYVTKKLTGQAAEFYETQNIIPEFSLMSRRPGIGRLYYEDHKDKIFHDQEIILKTNKGKKVFRPPRYFDQLFDIDYPEENQKIKEFRIEQAKINNALKMNNTSLEYLDQLKVEEANLEARIRVLERSKV